MVERERGTPGGGAGSLRRRFAAARERAATSVSPRQVGQLLWDAVHRIGAPLRRLPLSRALAPHLNRLGPHLNRLGPHLNRLGPRVGRLAGVVAVAIAGSAVGAGLAPPTSTHVGPFQLQLRVVPSLHPGVILQLPPAGRVQFDTHRAPVAVRATMGEVDLEGARRLLESRAALDQLERSAPDTLREATVRATATTAGCALLGAVTLSALVYRRRLRRTAQVATALAVVLAATSGVAAATFDADKMAQPRFTGLLSKAPYIAGQAETLLARLQTYRAGLAAIVEGVTQLYATSGDLPTVPGSASDDVVTLLHVSDLHLNPIAFDLIAQLVRQFAVDLVVDTGDITTWGTEVEGSTLSRVGQVGAPYVFVRGNHDSRRTQAAVAASSNAIVLDGDVAEVEGLVIGGIGDPVFTPDQPQGGGSPRGGADRSAGPPDGPGTTDGPPEDLTGRGPPTAGAGPSTGHSGSGTGQALPTSGLRTEPGQPFAASPDPEVRAGDRLAELIRTWDQTHPQKPVSIAAVHNPRAVGPLLGTVPVVLAGHTHERDVSVDAHTGTRIMVEGSTGGAGVTATGIAAAEEGKPVPLTATLIHLARRGPQAGQVLAYDQVTVGGLGLASISLNRTVVRPSEEPKPPSEGPKPGNSTMPPAPGPVPTAPTASTTSAGGALRTGVPSSPHLYALVSRCRAARCGFTFIP